MGSDLPTSPKDELLDQIDFLIDKCSGHCCDILPACRAEIVRLRGLERGEEKELTCITDSKEGLEPDTGFAEWVRSLDTTYAELIIEAYEKARQHQTELRRELAKARASDTIGRKLLAGRDATLGILRAQLAAKDTALRECDEIATLICTRQETPYPAEVEDIQTIARAALEGE